MSAGPFTRGTYELDSGKFTGIKFQPEDIEAVFHEGTTNTTNSLPTENINSDVPGVRIAGSRKVKNVVHARMAVLKAPLTGQPAGYKGGGITRIPVFKKATYAAIVGKQDMTCTYLGVTFDLIGTIAEEIHFR